MRRFSISTIVFAITIFMLAVSQYQQDSATKKQASDQQYVDLWLGTMANFPPGTVAFLTDRNDLVELASRRNIPVVKYAEIFSNGDGLKHYTNIAQRQTGYQLAYDTEFYFFDTGGYPLGSYVFRKDGTPRIFALKKTSLGDCIASPSVNFETFGDSDFVVAEVYDSATPCFVPSN